MNKSICNTPPRRCERKRSNPVLRTADSSKSSTRSRAKWTKSKDPSLGQRLRRFCEIRSMCSRESRFRGSAFFPRVRGWWSQEETVAEVLPSPELADDALDRFERFRRGESGSQLSLSSMEVSSVIQYSAPGMVPLGNCRPLRGFCRRKITFNSGDACKGSDWNGAKITGLSLALPYSRVFDERASYPGKPGHKLL